VWIEEFSVDASCQSAVKLRLLGAAAAWPTRLKVPLDEQLRKRELV
jgi:hypothetical protein